MPTNPKYGLTLAMAVFMGAGIALSGCSSKEKVDTYQEQPVDSLYNNAIDLMGAGKYSDAAKAFDEVERQHPYSVWATKAQLMGAYSLYEAENYDDAIVALDRFIQLHPGNPDISYAYYLRALCYYEQISDVRRDQSNTVRAANALSEVVRRFPDTPYARDARLKLDLARDHLSGKEMSVGRYYLNQKQYLAALNRFKVVIMNYDQTTHVPEALYRLVEINTLLGLNKEAVRVASVLGYNFPGSDWYEDAYKLVGGENMNAIPQGEVDMPVRSAVGPVSSQPLDDM